MKFVRFFWLVVAGIVATSVVTVTPPLAPPPIMSMPVAGLGAFHVSQTAESSVIDYKFDKANNADLFDAIDTATLAALVREINTKNPLLSDTIKEIINAHPIGLPSTSTVENWVDFRGTVTVTADGLRLTVPEVDVNASASVWVHFGAIVAGILAGLAVRALCLATFTGTGAIALEPACAYIGGFMGGFVRGVIIQAVDNTLTDPKQWAVTLVTSMITGFGAGAWEAGINTWARVTLPRLIKTAATALRGLSLPNWVNPLRPFLNRAADVATELAEVLPDVVAETPAPPPSGIGGTLKVMVVGDSMSHGHEGDYTWRYRLWQWFQEQRLSVDFVGPYQGTQTPAPAGPPSPPRLQGEPEPAAGPPRTGGRYAPEAASFDSDHFAVWGRQAAQAKQLIREQVATYQPDVLLVGLGFNDMGWWVSGPDGTLASMKSLVDNARAAKPNLRFALANVPQRTKIDGRDDLPANTDTYNRMLAGAIPTWSTSTSPVKLVDWRGSYGCEVSSCPAGYDGLHPDAMGEHQIAGAFARTLHHGYFLGTSVPVAPAAVPSRATPTPSGVSAAAGPGGLVVTWNPVFGAYGYTVRSRLVGQPRWNEFRIGTNRYDNGWVLDGQQMEAQVRTDNGDQQSDWSPVVSVTVRPRTAPGPTNVLTLTTPEGFDISWDPPTGAHTDTIERYGVIAYDLDTPGAYVSVVGIRGRRASIGGLISGHRYLVAVESWNAAGGGFPSAGRAVVVGAGLPPAPTDLRVTAINPTTVRLAWNGSDTAGGYEVSIRNIHDDSVSREVAVGTSHEIAYLFPGYWNFEFCVRAFNGIQTSNSSNCVTLPPGTAAGEPITPPPSDAQSAFDGVTRIAATAVN